jgi:hypothetical protein
MQESVSPERDPAAGWLQVQVGAGEGDQARWQRAVRAAARVVGPLWPEGYSRGPFSYATPVLAMICVGLYPGQDPDEVQVSDLLRALRGEQGQGWLGERLSAALRESSGTELGALLTQLRTKPVFFEHSLDWPSESVPDFREPLAGVVEWTIAALERALAAEAGTSAP